jgi:(+)-trans-carveol dehydrogenase
MSLLRDKVVLISGVARGQGRSHARRCAEEGADIIGFDVLQSYPTVAYSMATQDDLDETVALVEKLGRRIVTGQADVRHRVSIERVVGKGLDVLGRIDVVVANAGIFPPGMPFWTIPEAEWDDVMDVNLKGVWNTLSAAVPPMIEAGQGGSVIITSSGAALRGSPNIADYVASKMGVIGLMKSAANELAPHRIRVNCICPSIVETDMILNEALYKLVRPDLVHPTLEDAKVVLTQLHAIQEPYIDSEDVSEAVVWLASDRSRFVTGTTLPVDLGLSNRP